MTKLKSVNIKGKEYVEVNERIRYFRENYKDASILTEMLSNDMGTCVFRAQIIVNNQIVAVGHAYEKEGSTFINKTSYIENCETSAIGRALGIFGVGIDTSVASAEEVGNAIVQKEVEIEPLSEEKEKELKDGMVKAHQEGNLKEFFFRMNPSEKEQLRDFANELRTS